MRYELMRPSQIREAIKRRTPVVLPLGVLEYHSEHLPVGMDTLAVYYFVSKYNCISCFTVKNNIISKCCHII